jgi:hypothetical protein
MEILIKVNLVNGLPRIAALRARDRRATRSLDPISQRRSILPAGGSIVLIDPDQCRPTIPSNY